MTRDWVWIRVGVESDFLRTWTSNVRTHWTLSWTLTTSLLAAQNSPPD